MTNAENPSPEATKELPVLQIDATTTREDAYIARTARVVLEHMQALGMAADARNEKKAGEINVPFGMMGGSIRTFLEKPGLNEDGSIPEKTPFQEYIEKIVVRVEERLDSEGTDLVRFADYSQHVREMVNGLGVLALDESDEDVATDLADPTVVLEKIQPDEFHRITEGETRQLAGVFKEIYPRVARVLLRELSEAKQKELAAKGKK